MPFAGLRKLHERTMEAYRQNQEENMEPWKRKVMDIHEQADFLFYLEEGLEEDRQERKLLLRGQLVKGDPEPGTRIYFFTGQGDLMGSGLLCSRPEEKEAERKGLFKRRRNEMIIQLVTYLDMEAESMDNLELSRPFNNILLDASLITDRLF